jgi:hypothetical protein
LYTGLPAGKKAGFMPGSLTHIRLAIALLDVFDMPSPYHFIAGSLAPDAGELLPDKSYAPPKTITHFKMRDRKPFALADWIFYRRYLLERAAAPSPEEASFLHGYFWHLVSDNLWAYRIGRVLVREGFAAVDAHFLVTYPAFALPPPEPLSIPPEIEQLLERRLIERKITEMAHLLAHRPSAYPPDVSLPDVQKVADFIAEACELFPRLLKRLKQGSYPPEDAISVLSDIQQ